MKKVIPAILLLFLIARVNVSQTVEQRIQVNTSNSQNFEFTLQVALDKDSSAIGNAVSRFHFNPNVLTFPEKPKVITDFTFHDLYSSNFKTSVSHPSSGTVSINVVNIGGSTQKFTDSFIDLATIKFDVSGASAYHGLKQGLQQFYAPYSTSIWNIGSISISEIGEVYIPKPISPHNQTTKNGKEVSFSWEPVDGALYYHLEVSLDRRFKHLAYSVNDISESKFSLLKMLEGTEYFWRVRTFTINGFSHFSKSIPFTIGIEEPSDLISSAYNDQFVRLNWKNNSPATLNIVIERKISDSEENIKFEVIDTIDGSKTSYLDPFIESDKKYTYRLRAINNETESVYSDSVSISMKVENNDENTNLPKEFNLQQNYPNPFNPSTTINYALKENSDVKIIVYSLLGEKITTLVNKAQNAGTYDFVWNASHLPSGIYIYIMTAESNISDQSFQNVKKMILLK